MRFLIVLLILTSLLAGHTYWFCRLWRLVGRTPQPVRSVVRGLGGVAYALVILLLLTAGFTARRDALWQHAWLVGIVGWWVTSAFLAFVLVQMVLLIGWMCRLVSRLWTPPKSDPEALEEDVAAAGEKVEIDYGRRGFLQTSTLVLPDAQPRGISQPAYRGLGKPGELPLFRVND